MKIIAAKWKQVKNLKTFYLHYTEKGYQEIKLILSLLRKICSSLNFINVGMILIRMFVLTNMESQCPQAQNKRRVETSCSWTARGQKMKRICARGNCMGKCRVEKHMECFGNDEFLTDRAMGADVKQKKKKKTIFMNILWICRVLCWKRIREKLDITALQWNASRLFTNIPWPYRNE